MFLASIALLLVTGSWQPIVFWTLVLALAVGILMMSGRIRESYVTSILIGAGGVILGAYMLWSGLSNGDTQTELMLYGTLTLIGVAAMIHAGWLILKS